MIKPSPFRNWLLHLACQALVWSRFGLMLFSVCLYSSPIRAQWRSPTLKLSEPVRPLPGQLDALALFNSNSPELVRQTGILLSTFPPTGKREPEAHLDFPFQGEFAIFAHHVTQSRVPQDLRTLYLGILLHNPNPAPVNVTIPTAASYLSQPDAPFIALSTFVPNAQGRFFAGPGSRVMNEILRNWRQVDFLPQLQIPPQSSHLLLNAPMPIAQLDPPLNGRSTYVRLHSDGPVYAASLAMFAPLDGMGQQSAPTLAHWEQVLTRGRLVKPRDHRPTPLDDPTPSVIYGRVAGVSQGITWEATLSDRDLPSDSAPMLTIPVAGEVIAYGLSTLSQGTFGTGQIQSAPMLVRYPDTAYLANGNYGLNYRLEIPLSNPTSASQTVTLAIHTPLKSDQATPQLTFLQPASPDIFFRGTVRVRYRDDRHVTQNRYFHLVQHRGQRGAPLAKLTLAPGDRRPVTLEFLYPPDATPPQVLTISTLRPSALPGIPGDRFPVIPVLPQPE